MAVHVPDLAKRLAVALLAVAAARAIASDEETAAGAAASFRPAPALEEVIVTAQRREERLQDVPISASVFSTQQLERLQIDDLGELQFAAPNLSVAPSQTAPTSASIAMRGQFEVDTTPTVDPAVGLYLDGVYIARMTGANLDLVDLDRVEVLRGPQGTLFGRNTIGGAINLVPQRPTSQFDALLKARLGNYDLQEVTGFLNTPSLSGRIATRLTAMHSEHGGYAQNTLLGTDFSDADTDFARLQLQLAPAPGTQLNLAVDLTQSESGSQQRTMLAVLPQRAGQPSRNRGVDRMGRVRNSHDRVRSADIQVDHRLPRARNPRDRQRSGWNAVRSRRDFSSPRRAASVQ